jgi:hydrogenase large subunit
VLLGCWGSLNNPEYCDFTYRNMADWGRKMFVTPGVVVDGRLVTTSLVDINLGIRILLGHSYYEDWEDQEMFVTSDPLGNLVDFGYIKSTGSSVQINLPRTVTKPEVTFEWKIPRDKEGRPLSNAIERDRARTYFQAYAAACALYFTERALAEIRAGRTKTWEPFSVPDEANSCGFTEAVRGVLSHHMVVRGGKIANYHPYPPTPWNASVRDVYGTPGPYEDAVQNTPIFEENPPETFKGIDIMRTVRSFDPCLPCGVHMYLGNGKTLEKVHSPMTVTLST